MGPGACPLRTPLGLAKAEKSTGILPVQGELHDQGLPHRLDFVPVSAHGTQPRKDAPAWATTLRPGLDGVS